MTTTQTPEAPPRTAYEAADRLADAGQHVHVVADGHAVCRTGHCAPGRP